MAFEFNWPEFDPALVEEVKSKVTVLLNQGEKPEAICADLTVSELSFGTQAPHLELVDIPDVSENVFKAVFRVAYSGDGYLALRTKVQVNPFYPASSKTNRAIQDLGILIAHESVVVPLALKISQLQLEGVLEISLSKNDSQAKVAAFFREDPLKSVTITSSFDEFGSVKKYLQETVEGSLRKLFVEDLPKIMDSVSAKIKLPDQASSSNPSSPSFPPSVLSSSASPSTSSFSSSSSSSSSSSALSSSNSS
jgi:distribution and morphology protein 34